MTKKIIFNCMLIALMLCLIFFSPVCIEGANKGLTLCLTSVVPSLFPFFVISYLSKDLGKLLSKVFSPIMSVLFKLNGKLVMPLVLGFTGGYPVGALSCSQLYKSGSCSKEEAQRLLNICNNTGPAFIMGVCGGSIFKSVKIGFILYFIHIASAILGGILLNIGNKKINSNRVVVNQAQEEVPIFNAITSAIKESFYSAINVTAFVTFFSVVIAILISTGVFEVITSCLLPVFQFFSFNAQDLQSVLIGSVELASGLTSINPQSPLAIPIASFMLAFGGISVHFQSISVISDCNFSIKQYIFSKFIHGIIAFSLASFYIFFIPVPTVAFTIKPYNFRETMFASTFFLICIVIVVIIQRKLIDISSKNKKNKL